VSGDLAARAASTDARDCLYSLRIDERTGREGALSDALKSVAELWSRTASTKHSRHCALHLWRRRRVLSGSSDLVQRLASEASKKLNGAGLSARGGEKAGPQGVDFAAMLDG
ncbi:unnamed protein product, partial [Prorocentrum cordatum]